MSVNTKTVEGRRELRFSSLDDLQAEVERIAAGEVTMLGNWTLAQIFEHLAAGLNSAIDGSSFKASFMMRVMAPMMKKKFLQGGIPAGFTIPKEAHAQFLPANDVETHTAREKLEAAIARFRSAETFAPHPLFGNLTRAELVQFHLRHAEMHLSFAIPAE